MMQIPDPVHGYISLEGMYADIVNTAEFQRLRYVEQVSFRPSYPGARHDRFIHSLGTYHLATKFAESFFVNLRKDVPDIKVSAKDQKMLTETFRYAALLHDIGHAPFSHTTEDFFLEPIDQKTNLPQVWVDLREAVRKVSQIEGTLFEAENEENGKAHEIVSALVLVSKWDILTNSKKREPVDLPLAARMVIGFTYKTSAVDEYLKKPVATFIETYKKTENKAPCTKAVEAFKKVEEARIAIEFPRDSKAVEKHLKDAVEKFRKAYKKTHKEDPDDKTVKMFEQFESDRMVIDFPEGPCTLDKYLKKAVRKFREAYQNVKNKDPEGKAVEAFKEIEGARIRDRLSLRNCLIQMLNYSTLDVDRLDYMGRDSALTGFLNAPLDLPCLASSVTAVRDADGWLVPAYRDNALRVFDLMFQAKLSHDAWVIGSPASIYEAELLKHCIRGLGSKYMSTIFTPKALSREGVDCADPTSRRRKKHYRLLSDVDISADLKAQSGPLYDELYTRKHGVRRTAVWRSYYEYHHIFDAPDLKLTQKQGLKPEHVSAYFAPLIEYLTDQKNGDDGNNILVFDNDSFATISALPDKDKKITHPAKTLNKFLSAYTNGRYSVVLVKQTNSITLKLDPEEIRILFAKENIPARSDGRAYSTYRELTGLEKNHIARDYFYIFRHGVLGHKQLEALREQVHTAICDAITEGIIMIKEESK